MIFVLIYQLDKIQGLTHPKQWPLVRQAYLDLVLGMYRHDETYMYSEPI